jgi:hypothetical protein
MLCLSAMAKADEINPNDNIKTDKSNRTIEILLSPINLAPDIISNTVLYLFNPICSISKGEDVSNLWFLVSISAPVLGLVTGIMDSWHGYPFWNPVALDEHRKY